MLVGLHAHGMTPAACSRVDLKVRCTFVISMLHSDCDDQGNIGQTCRAVRARHAWGLYSMSIVFEASKSC